MTDESKPLSKAEIADIAWALEDGKADPQANGYWMWKYACRLLATIRQRDREIAELKALLNPKQARP